MRRAKGFSLIELLIVVAILLIVAAIAIPNLLRSRMAANEASAVATMRTIATANVTYQSAYNIGYAGDLNHLGPPAGAALPSSAAADLVDSAVSGGCPSACVSNLATKSGYNFTYVAPVPMPTQLNPNRSYTVVGTPLGANTGNGTFCVDQTNTILKDSSGASVGAAGTGCVSDGWVIGGTINPI